MKSAIALINPYPRIDAVFSPLAEELNLTVKKYSGIRPMADDLNSKVLPVKELALVMVTGTSEENDPGQYRKNMSLLAQLAKHSKLKDMPVLFLGYKGCAELSSSCAERGAEYLDLPVKKSVLVEKIRNLIDGTGRGYKNKRGFESTPITTERKAAAESERRLATVMFADISGFTAMSEKMDPEDVTRVMNGVFHRMETVIKEHGGHIDKFIGDCVMVLFGVPKAIENAPLQAVNTAIEMRNALYSFNRDNNLAIPLDIHIGMNTGPVVSGHVGGSDKKDYTVMGDAVNLASRIEGASVKGQILVGPDTYRATQGEFEYKALAPVTLKGKADPVPVYEVLSVKEAAARRRKPAERTDVGPERMIYSEMVGRDEELNELRHAVTGLIKGKGGIVNVIGEAGIGKSRLMSELKADPAMKQVAILEGQAISMGRNLSFHPIIDLLKHWAGILEDDSEQDAFAKLEKAVRAVHPAEADEIIPFVGTLMGMKLSGKYAERVKGIEGEALEKLIFKNIRELLIKGSEIRPMIIRIEDLHWADTSSIELLSSLFRLAEKYRILFLNFFRPNYEETGDRVVKTLKEEFPDNYTEIIIKPLDGNESDTLISNLLNIRGIPQTLKDQITERAGGNPFFIEEVVRALIDEGAVVKKGDSFAVTEKIHDVKVPLTINEVLMSRIDRLDEETRNLVKTASVIGRYFFYKIIAQVAENISDIDNRLGYLEDIQLIRERKRMDELEYLFKHALAQEAAYESLLIQKRKELHLLVANAIEKVFAERLHEFYGMLAYHYSMGVNLDKTEEYMLKAGEEAMKSAASSEALEYFIQAMKLYRAKPAAMQDGKTLSYIEKCTAMALFNRGKFRDAIAYFNSYLKKKGITSYNVGIALILRSFVSLLVIVCYLFFPLLRRKKIADAADGEIFEIQLLKLVIYTYIDQKQFFFESMIYVKDVMNYDINSNVAIYKILSGTPMVFSWTGLSFTISSKIIKIIDKELINKKNTGVFLDVTARLMQYLLSGEWEKMRYDTSHVTEGLMQGEIYSQMGYLIFHSMHSYETGNFDQACLVINQLLSIADAYNFDFARVNYYRMQAKQLMKRRMIEEAMGFIPGGIDIIKKTDFKIMEILLRSFLIRLFLYKNDSSQAAELLESTRKELAKIRLVPIMYDDFLISEFYYFLQMLESASVGNDKKQYKKRLVPIIKKALGNAKKVAPDRTEIFRFVGTYCWLTGKQKKALRWWKKSIDDGERLGARLELSRTYFEVGKRILSVALDTTPQGATRATSVRSPSDSVRNRIEGSDSNIKLTKKIIGLYAGECLDKAETMFKEMGLEWDLEQLEKIR